MRSRTRTPSAFAVIAALAGLHAVGCKPKVHERTPVAVRVETVTPIADFGETKYSGTLEAETRIDLAFRLPGYLKWVATVPDTRGGAKRSAKRAIQSGDRVTRGMVLARLRETDYKHKLSELRGMSTEAAATYRKSAADLARAKSLLSEDAISKAEYDAIQARHDALAGTANAATARFGQAGLALSDTELTSSIDGIILDRRAEVGALISPGVPVIVVADTSRVKVTFGVPDTVQRGLALDSKVKVSTDAVAERTFDATITRIAAQADAKTRGFDVEATIDNPDGVLKVGMVANIRLERPSQPHAAIRIPLSAVVRVHPSEKTFWVYVAQDAPQGAVVAPRQVELGNLVKSRVEVLAGLTAGDRVVTQGATLVTNGQRVNVIPGSEPSPSGSGAP